MTSKSSEEIRAKFQECLEELAREQGIWRQNLLDLLRAELSPLQRAWGVNLNSLDFARRTVAANLNVHIEHLIPGSKERVFEDDESKERYRHTVGVVFGCYTFPESEKRGPHQRRKWLANGAPGALRVSDATSKRYFKDAIVQIVDQLMSDDYKPVVIDEPALTPETIASDLPQVPVNPPTSHLTKADLEALIRLAGEHFAPHQHIHSASKGFLGALGFPTLRRHVAITSHVMSEIDQTIRATPRLTTLAEKNPRALAILALSGGTTSGTRQAGDEIIDDFGDYDAWRALAYAQTFVNRKYGRRNTAAALKILAQKQSQPIDPGRFDIVWAGVKRLAGRNLDLLITLLDMYQEQSRAHGRVDLGGKWNDREKLDLAGWSSSRAADRGDDELSVMLVWLQTLADLTVLDGVSCTEPVDLVCGHSNQVRQLVGDDSTDKDGRRLCQGTLERMLKSATEQHRIDAVVILLEIRSVLVRANEKSRRLVTGFFERHALDPDVSDFARVLLDAACISELSASELQAKMRA